MMREGKAGFYKLADMNDAVRLKGGELELIPDVGTAHQTRCRSRQDCSTGTAAQRLVPHKNADCEMYDARDIGE